MDTSYDDICMMLKGMFGINAVKIATDSSEKYVLGIYDKSFKRELSNIKEHKNLSDYHANMVHYIISARSIEASIDMEERLVTKPCPGQPCVWKKDFHIRY